MERNDRHAELIDARRPLVEPQLEALARELAAFEQEHAAEAGRCRDAVCVGQCECGEGRR